MTSKNRAALIVKLQGLLKKYYKAAPTNQGRPLLEHVLYGALLEESPYDLADEAYAKCEQEFFDWNEVRVTSVTELAEVLSNLPCPTSTAVRLKRCLQGVFETFYSFDIDHLRKENLGKAVAKFESMPGISPFVVNHVCQHGLGGHAIPLNSSALKLLVMVGIVTPQEGRVGKVSGLERAIPKNKAIEFASCLHQAAVQFASSPLDTSVRDLVSGVNPDADLFAMAPEVVGKNFKKESNKAPNVAGVQPADTVQSLKISAFSKSNKVLDKGKDTDRGGASIAKFGGLKSPKASTKPKKVDLPKSVSPKSPKVTQKTDGNEPEKGRKVVHPKQEKMQTRPPAELNTSKSAVRKLPVSKNTPTAKVTSSAQDSKPGAKTTSKGKVAGKQDKSTSPSKNDILGKISSANSKKKKSKASDTALPGSHKLAKRKPR
jgi:endonuclease III